MLIQMVMVQLEETIIIQRMEQNARFKNWEMHLVIVQKTIA